MSSRNRRRLAGVAMAAVFAGIGAHSLTANSDRARTISLYNIHTKETVTVLYKQDGRYIPEAMTKLNWALRDWRQNEPTTMDPALIDLLWEVHTELGSAEPIHIISGFRSRGTNEMLRRTTGGQASESRHILGKAADVHFPDVPVKRLRYSALVRERGGVGYYPTSALPFVHLDTDRVRSWPRLPRYELALLFPNGRTQHQPADGGPVTKEDVQVAQSRHRDLAVQLATFHDTRNRPATAQVAEAPTKAAVPIMTAALSPELRTGPAGTPRLAAEPRLIDRPSRLTQPSPDERNKLSQLFALASFQPQLVSTPQPASRSKPATPLPAMASLTGVLQKPPAPSLPAAPQLATLISDPATTMTDIGRPGWSSAWAQAPAFDEEHPDELSYRPFPVTPYMTESASLDDPALVHLIHPDQTRTLEFLDSAGAMPPMRLRPTPQIARLMWAQEFKGGMADITKLFASGEDLVKPGAVASRAVKTGAK